MFSSHKVTPPRPRKRDTKIVSFAETQPNFLTNLHATLFVGEINHSVFQPGKVAVNWLNVFEI
jgi:hypothetical protein